MGTERSPNGLLIVSLRPSAGLLLGVSRRPKNRLMEGILPVDAAEEGEEEQEEAFELETHRSQNRKLAD